MLICCVKRGGENHKGSKRSDGIVTYSITHGTNSHGNNIIKMKINSIKNTEAKICKEITFFHPTTDDAFFDKYLFVHLAGSSPFADPGYGFELHNEEPWSRKFSLPQNHEVFLLFPLVYYYKMQKTCLLSALFTLVICTCILRNKFDSVGGFFFA